ncbi:MAG: methyltransferase domain-containing protein [Candidatus Heimdallarchaeota archaeon]|nr:methyltransferase domain-containing protein [Candidatus Heimdallarchaeota archaeon]
MDEFMKKNLDRWNETSAIHAKSDEYDLESFMKGRNSLHEIELNELTDVKGKTLLHLQCQFGMDTLSWARMGASRVVGIDFSNVAIDLANSINEELKLPAEFICSNIYDLPDVLEEEFDIVFTSYGVLVWLPDLDKWAKIVARYVKKGGTFFIAEFHPFMWIFDDENKSELVYRYPYFQGKEPLHFTSEYTYTDQDETIKNVETYEWQHTFGDIITALINEGLTIKSVKEYPYTLFPQFPFVEEVEKGIWKFRDDKYNVPMIYSIKATKE